MQSVTQDWQDTNRSLFTRQSQVIATIYRTDGKTPMIGGEDMISFSHIKNGDILSGSLTQDKITFVVRNRNNRLDYDAANDNDVYENARVDVQEGFLNANETAYDSISGGRYYITNVIKDGSGDQYTFYASTILSFMTEKCGQTFTGDAFSVAQRLITRAEASKGVPQSKIEFIGDYDIMSKVSISILESDGYSLAEALQLIANACRCVLYVSRDSKIHIEPISNVCTHYVLANKFLYKRLEVSFADRVGNVTLTSNHGGMVDGTSNTGDKIGGEQLMENPILYNDIESSHAIVFHTLLTLQNGRKRFNGNCRFDPAVDIFDVIVIPEGSSVSAACVTGINVTYNGAWKGDIQAMTVNGAKLDLRIKDLELLTLEQLESLNIEQLTGG